MKILLTCDPEIPVPPKYYGGVERLVDGLAIEYKKRGHQVFLLANPGSTCSGADEIFHFPALLSRGYLNVAKNALKLFRVARKIKPDVIHSFSRLLYTYPLLFTSKIPFIQTYGRFISPNSTKIAGIVGGKRMNFTSAAAHMLKHLKNKEKFTPVFNFVNTNYFVPDNNSKAEHLIFLGRIEDIKGAKECIETAIATQTKLIIAGNIQPGHEEYFNSYIKPHLNNPLIEYVGPLNDEQKLYYLQQSKAFLFPIKWEEPFGIVMAEAMACGVPVIGYNRGSVPEVVINGKTGFIVNSVEEMIEAVAKINSIDREVVRMDCVRRFSVDVIAEEYLKLMKTKI